ncbi:MAG: protease modulator HflC [Thermoguttaceae bacterium]|jgi:membrane protease subunit HflC|nr:protease modulator HflC [Thermoguttaceae bacterium]
MSTRTRVILISSMGLFLFLVLLARSLLFTVDERELAVVLQFGEPVQSYTEPGLKVKWPVIQEVRKLPKTLQFWSGEGREVLEDLPTADGKRIEVSAWAVWRITDPERFVRVLRTLENAELRVATFVRGETRNVITSNDLVEVVRSSDREMKYPVLTELLRVLQESDSEADVLEEAFPPEAEQADPEADDNAPAGPPDEALEEWVLAQTEAKERIRVGREKIVEMIKQRVQKSLAETGEDGEGGRGIELVDLGISRIDFVPRVREAAFDRQIARWESIASFYTNQGEKRKRQILNRTDARVQEILGEGRQRANELRGEVEARVIDMYADAIRETGEFYNFIRTLEAYKEALGKGTRLIMTTDSTLLKFLKDVGEAPEASLPQAPEP